jgi:predicted AAA+ superfamily ATPase
VIAALNEFNLKQGLILTYNQDDEFLIDGKKIKVLPVWKWLFE